MQKTDDQQFLYEIPVATGVIEATKQLVDLQNLRSRIHRYTPYRARSTFTCLKHLFCRLKLEGEELAKYGPSKPLDQQGIDKYAEGPVQKGPNYNEDPTGRRTGQGVSYQGHPWLDTWLEQVLIFMCST